MPVVTRSYVAGNFQLVLDGVKTPDDDALFAHRPCTG